MIKKTFKYIDKHLGRDSEIGKWRLFRSLEIPLPGEEKAFYEEKRRVEEEKKRIKSSKKPLFKKAIYFFLNKKVISLLLIASISYSISLSKKNDLLSKELKTINSSINIKGYEFDSKLNNDKEKEVYLTKKELNILLNAKLISLDEYQKQKITNSLPNKHKKDLKKLVGLLLEQGQRPGIRRTDFFYKITNNQLDQISRQSLKSILIANTGFNIEPNQKVQKYASMAPIYDVNFLNYRSDFAKKNGFPLDEQFVNDDMDKNLDAVEFSVKTEGYRSRCLLKLLINKRLKIDYPDQDLTTNFRSSINKIRFPELSTEENNAMIKKYRKDLKEFKNFNRNVKYGKDHADFRYHMNTYLQADDSGRLSTYLVESTPRFFKDSHYLLLSIGCNDLPRRILERKKPYVMIKKAGGRDYSNPSSHGKSKEQSMKEDFYKLALPKRAIDKIIPVMKMTDRWVSFINQNGVLLVQDQTNN